MMATLADTYSWTADETAIKAYIGIIDTTQDVQLELFYGSAIELGDLYLDNPFENEDGSDKTHPVSIKLGLYEFTSNMLEQREIKPGLLSVKEGDVQLNFGLTLIRDYFQKPLPPAVQRFWFPFKLGRRTNKDGKRVGSLMR